MATFASIYEFEEPCEIVITDAKTAMDHFNFMNWLCCIHTGWDYAAYARDFPEVLSIKQRKIWVPSWREANEIRKEMNLTIV